ncbi:tetratricopeptide repeat protein [Thalassobaculum salexigens]|uniref:tetratricopeptide repeat-containing glycosyltransferase family protein n=1 Tax=Thalassobaculum salexigens TaxID=455360 RepID=UPI0004113DD0|nr:tetratricopeptide repeat-containing glycosyltransferase family protein [Thalassobaculum salexigens]
MTVAVTTALSAGLHAHRLGDLNKAIAVYGAVLDLAPDHPTARHLRGFALLQSGRIADARLDLQAAVRAAPTNGNAWMHLSVCLDRLGQSATQTARRAVLLQPGGQEALDVLVRHRSGEDRALRWLLALAPGDATVWRRAGLARARRTPAFAATDFRRALCLAPADPWIGLDLAEVERRILRPETALMLADRALVVLPADPRALADRAASAIELDAVSPALADTHRAALLDPAHTAAWGNRAETLYRLARYEAAVTCGSRARVTAPTDPEVLANLAAYRLATGDLAGGWPIFRNRPARRGIPGPDLPRWSGEAGVRLLVLTEQGLGDELLFSTLWSDLDRQLAQGRLAAVTVEADERLIPLGARALPRLAWRRRLRPNPADGPFTHWCLAGDLMELLRPDIASFAAAKPGLAPDPNRVAEWHGWLDRETRRRPAIGLCWRSGSRAGHRRRHYPTLGDCAALLSLTNRFFVVLQYDDCRSDLEGLALGTGTEIVLPPDLDRHDDQEGVAALMAALDLVVSADTAVLALAGALGVPAVGFSLHPGWVALGQGRQPWFPRIERVFRPPDMPWPEAMSEVARTVERVLSDRT